ncbi:phosphoenolpyruvate carboxykinase (GTP) [Pseudokineococcus marinus]|uniref:Phosphoenolpyruvate carboxykinase [GTP] n=1 Tax=Pseudokineococcus marinus TaxID=351215 RepID=A0A849BIT0_9ACTN|nr:phosphoenolpyruvate carboxykinase (GTP) [Pseudokineococcus marinus]NNH23090.1 phosphoenolpyruvate carboxykinase (GTP) [Pseudokineococcus marinus]
MTTNAPADPRPDAPAAPSARTAPGVPSRLEGTSHARLAAWVREVVELVEPAAVRWADGSEQEWRALTDELVAAGTAIRLDPQRKPDSYLVRSDPGDVARVEDRTFICSRTREEAGPTNNWVDPDEMRAELTGLFRGSMRGRTLHVIPFVMGSLRAEHPMFGVEITDSPYVVASMHVMATVGAEVLAQMERTDADFVPCLHSVGAPLEPGQQDVPWPCSETKRIVHFPEERSVWSYGSGYGGNALLGKKCYALRIASVIARDEGWLAEHMLVLRLTDPAGEVHHVAAAFPSACGKTNLAMLQTTLPGWTAETVGDDIAWIRPDARGGLRATNPEAGLFGVAPGTGWSTNPTAMRAVAAGRSIFTNVALTDDGDVWWEGMTDEPPAHLVDWRGRDWTPASDEPAAHPNSRFCTPIHQLPSLAAAYEDPEGVPLSAILVGGRRRTTVPLVVEARDWQHGVFLAATLSSETTAAATGQVGVVRRDPVAMLPFIGYDAGDYLSHWLRVGEGLSPERRPKIFCVNWFRRGDDGRFLWPGFGENTRVLAWVVGRAAGRGDARETPVGLVPPVDALDLRGLETDPDDVRAALAVDADEWRAELPEVGAWLDALGPTVPAALHAEHEELARRLG